jgi:hypothetical protein
VNVSLSRSPVRRGYDPPVSSQLTEGPDAVLAAVAAERRRQDARWGEQNHPDGAGPAYAAEATRRRDECEQAAASGTLTWRHILLEEVAEAGAEQEPKRLREELIQVAAVAVAWAQAIDRRVQPKGPSQPCPESE